jgi:hypothetical protein
LRSEEQTSPRRPSLSNQTNQIALKGESLVPGILQALLRAPPSDCSGLQVQVDERAVSDDIIRDLLFFSSLRWMHRWPATSWWDADTCARTRRGCASLASLRRAETRRATSLFGPQRRSLRPIRFWYFVFEGHIILVARCLRCI